MLPQTGRPLTMSTPQAPRLSVVLPVYNGARYLRDSLDSVLRQTFTDFEVLVLDDGSTDRSLEIVAARPDPRIRVIRQAGNLGLVPTLNRGLADARGAYVARHDADDIALPGRFAAQVRALDAQPATLVVGTWVQLIDGDGALLKTWRYPTHPIAVEWMLHFDSAVGHPSAMYRASAVRDAGGYDPNFPYAEDFELWTRLSRAGEVRNLPEVLEQYRVHEASLSRTHAQVQRETRQRIAGGNIARTLGRSVPEALVASLLDAGRAGTDDPSLAIDTLFELGDRFLARRQPAADARVEIEDDLLDRVCARLAALPPVARAGAMARVWSRVPVRQRLSVRWPSLLVHAGVKAGLRRLLGTRD